MRFEVLVNCGSGPGKGGPDDDEVEQQCADIRAAFQAAGAEADVEVLDLDDFEGHVRRAAERGADAVVLAGGDGTLGSAAGALVDTDHVLGVLPMGTFNHFAKDLGIPTDLHEAAAALARGEVRRIDVGQVGDRTFVNNSVLGAYPEVVALRDRLRDERGWGKVRAVPAAAWQVLRRFPLHRLTISTPGAPTRTKARTPIVFIGNGRYDDGGRQRIGERSSFDTGDLSVYVAHAVSRWGLVKVVFEAFVKGTDDASTLDRIDAAEITIDAERGRLRVALDGEVTLLPTPLTYRCRPEALKVLVPPPPDEPADTGEA